jgi:hypothetical protein
VSADIRSVLAKLIETTMYRSDIPTGDAFH